MMTEVEIHPLDLQEHGPWVPDCPMCVQLRAANEVGLYVFMRAVCNHFERDHNIVLVGGDRRD